MMAAPRIYRKKHEIPKFIGGKPYAEVENDFRERSKKLADMISQFQKDTKCDGHTTINLMFFIIDNFFVECKRLNKGNQCVFCVDITNNFIREAKKVLKKKHNNGIDGNMIELGPGFGG